jgi:RNA polymerase sigma-70 factor (ECF subfamily)
MRESLEQLLRAADVPSPERAEALWAEYRSGGPGAEAAFNTLLAWYGLVIYRRIWGFLRSDAAEDVFQDVLAKLHRERQKLDTFEHALRWLRTVAVRQCVDAHRQSTRRNTRERRASRPEDEAPLGEQIELQEMLAVALSKLSAEHREAVALVFFEGLDKQDAAKVLGINRDTLADRLTVALSRLQKLVPTPAMLAAGGVAGMQAALSARPQPPSASRLGELAKAAWSNVPPSGLWMGKAAVVLAGLAGFGAVTWASWPRPEPTPAVADSAAKQTAQTAANEEETLQAKNVRLTRRDVVPRVLPELQKFLPPDNPIRLVNVHGIGSKVECEFRTTKPVLPLFGKPAGFRVRYCVLRRWMEMESDLDGSGAWQRVDPERPILLELAIPLLPRKEGVVGREQAGAIRRAFDQLPGDDRAERESVAFWFGSPRHAEGELFLPTGSRAMAGNSRDLFFHAGDEGLYVLHDGAWRYGGYCPGWLSEADETRLYRREAVWVQTRPIEPRDAPWTPLCPCPTGPKEKPLPHALLRAGGGFLFLSTHEPALWVRPLADPDAPWARGPWPPGADPALFAVVGDRLVAARGGELIARPLGGDWVPVGPLPAGLAAGQPGVAGLTAWRGWVLVWPLGGGPIHARSLDPGDTWRVIGRAGPVAR